MTSNGNTSSGCQKAPAGGDHGPSTGGGAGTTTTPACSSSYRDFLADERPKIDAALKSFASISMARIATSTSKESHSGGGGGDDDERNIHHEEPGEVLAMTRRLSKAINSHVVPVGGGNDSSLLWQLAEQKRRSRHRSGAEPAGGAGAEAKIADSADVLGRNQEQLRREVTAQVWNGVVCRKEKPTKEFGRTALRCVWNGIADFSQKLEPTKGSAAASGYAASTGQRGGGGGGGEDEKYESFAREFGRLLFQDTAAANEEGIGDARLVWDADGGQSELARRAKARAERASLRRREEEEEEEGEEDTNGGEGDNGNGTSLTIEELPP